MQDGVPTHISRSVRHLLRQTFLDDRVISFIPQKLGLLTHEISPHVISGYGVS